MSTSPLSSTFQPSPNNVPKNAHPYAIKSSSSGNLTRSNSISNTAINHHYVPLPLAKRTKVIGKRKHYVLSRKLKSEPDDESPTPGGDPDAVLTSPTRISVKVKRRESFPTSVAESHKTESEDALEALPVCNLPINCPDSNPFKANPKQWTPFQLVAYLSSTLRLPGGDMVPAPVMRKIAAFIVQHNLNGRTFLKMTDSDYNAYDIDPLWKGSLTIANITLRQSLVQGQVLGSIKASSISDEDLLFLRETDEEHTPNAPIVSPTTPGAYIPWDKRRTLGRLQAGRVKGIAHKYERPHSAEESNYDPSGRRISGFLDKDENESESGSDVSFPESPCLENNDSHPIVHEDGSPLLQDAGPFLDEPTVQELVRTQSPPSHSWGAKAWEEEDRTNITARKITQEQGNAEDILTENTDKNQYSRPKLLTSLFSGPETDIPRTELPEKTGEISEKKQHASEHVPTNSEVSPSSEDTDVLPTMVGFNTSAESSESSFTSLWCKSESPSTSPGSSLFVTESPYQEAKAPRTDLVKKNKSYESLQETLRIIQERLVVVEERLFDLEKQGAGQKHGVHASNAEERTAKVTVKPDISLPGCSVLSPAITQVYKHDAVKDSDRHKSGKNYALSDMNVYSYMFYASVGLAALVVDRIVLGRRKS